MTNWSANNFGFSMRDCDPVVSTVQPATLTSGRGYGLVDRFAATEGPQTRPSPPPATDKSNFGNLALGKATFAIWDSKNNSSTSQRIGNSGSPQNDTWGSKTGSAEISFNLNPWDQKI